MSDVSGAAPEGQGCTTGCPGSQCRKRAALWLPPLHLMVLLPLMQVTLTVHLTENALLGAAATLVVKNIPGGVHTGGADLGGMGPTQPPSVCGDNIGGGLVFLWKGFRGEKDEQGLELVTGLQVPKETSEISYLGSLLQVCS